MKLLRVPMDRLSSGDRQLDVEGARYVARVHRLGAGDVFVGFDPEQGVQAVVRIIRVVRGRVFVNVDACEKAVQVADHDLWLLLGITKADSFDLATREATALGVTTLVPVVMDRSQGRSAADAEKRMARWRRLCVQGARQSGRGDIPLIVEPCSLSAALRLVPPHVTKLCAWARTDQNVRLAQVLDGRNSSHGAAWLIGPEGGVTASEVSAAERAGFSLVSLGPFVLRTETAVMSALGAWHALRAS